MPDERLECLRRFQQDAFPHYRDQFQQVVDDGKRPPTLFIGCNDSRVVPYLLTGAGRAVSRAQRRVLATESWGGMNAVPLLHVPPCGRRLPAIACVQLVKNIEQ